jgi:ABC-type transport system involved in multi-copper enzyme maturation permease subunit
VIMLISSAFLIAYCVKVVRRVALRQVTGAVESVPKYKKIFGKNRIFPGKNQTAEYTGVIREIKGHPVFWKELRTPLIQGGEGRNSIIGLVITIVALFVTYFICNHQRVLDEDFTHVSYSLMFVIIGSIFTMVFAATCITSEKESSSWPILLTTSLSEWQIIWEKALGVFCRSLPVWFLLTGHILIFVVLGYIHPIAIVQLAIVITGLTAFLIGLGIYCSLRFRRTTSAIVANFLFTGFVWIALPIVLGLSGVFFNRRGFSSFYAASAQPLYLVSVIMNGAGGQDNAKLNLSRLNYNWEIGDIHPTMVYLVIVMAVNIFLGLFFIWRGRRWVRRKIF